jgi:hypothetical protein
MNTARALRAGIPAIYSAAILIGFLINPKAGIIVIIGGALLSAAAYSMIARATAPAAGARRPPRNRNRAR